MKILKQNEYKTVRLHTTKLPYVVEKSFTAFSVDQRQINTQYLYDALVWFYKKFGTIIGVPKPVEIDLCKYSVFMEYLEDLPNASYISSRTLGKTEDFFECCYQVRDDQGFLRDLQNSVVVTPHIQKLLESNFPQSLGFKGDLRENLVIGSQRVILADIDSIAIEPLGLSELVLYASLACSFDLRVLFVGLYSPLPVPIAYRYLDEEQAQQINEAAVELVSKNMDDLSSQIFIFKVKRATSVLASLVKQYYST